MLGRRDFLLWSAAGALLPLRELHALVEGQPSRTALATALQRAAHQLLETPPVFDDPVALRILGAQRVRWLGERLEQYRSFGERAMRAFLVMRSRYAEDELGIAVARDTRQYVVLGAGLDTFAYRNSHRGLRVFEVDHPSTQAWKRARLGEQGIELPRSLRYAPVDFEKQTLADGLRAAGFDAREPAFFSWLGVVIYLTPGAVTETLRMIASCARGSQVVFDFSPPVHMLGEFERRAHEARAARVARIGEPWIGYYEPRTFAQQLLDLGYSRALHLGVEELNERYFRARADGFRLYGSGRMMSARV